MGTVLGNAASSVPINNATAPSEPSQFSFNLPSAQPPQQPAAATSFRFQIAAQQPAAAAAAPFTFQLPAQQHQPTQLPAVAPFRFQLPAQQLQPVTTATAPSFSFHLPAQQYSSSNTILLNQSKLSNPPHLGLSGHTENVLHVHLSPSAVEQFKADKFSIGKIPRIPPPKEFH